MPATKRLILDLPAEQVDMIEARVAGGEFASASAYVSERIADEDAIDEADEASPEFQAWLEEGDEIVKRIDAGLERMIPLEDVMARLKQDLAERARDKADAALRKRA